MRFANRMLSWMCAGVLALGLQARPAQAAPERRPTNAHLEQACGEAPFDEPCTLEGTERRQLSGDVFEYSFRLKVGPGAYDRVTVHRVVREQSPGVPVRSAKSVFLVHGDAWGFRAAFLASTTSAAVPPQQSFAIYLAQQGVDVWGIDLRWVNVPPEASDFSFMKTWNLGLHARDVGTGLSLARAVRGFGGEAGKMVLLGWSRGAAVSYAYLNAETQQAPEKRQVRGFIPVDMAYKLAPGNESQRQAACQNHAALAGAQASGSYEGGAVGALLQGVGLLAINQPEGASSLVPGLDNRQAALTVGEATFALQNPPVIPSYHFAGGQFGADGIPTGLSWTRERFFFDFLTQASPYQSIGEQVDTFALWCGAPDVPYDDHLGEVTVPVLYVGAGGGFGQYGVYSTSLLGSRNVTVHLVQRFPESARIVDYGHADLWLADDAASSVWAPILDWVQRLCS